MITPILFLVVVSIATCPAQSDVCFRIPEETEQCVAASSHNPITESDAYISCLHKLLWKHPPGGNMTEADDTYFLQISERPLADATPPSGFRLRKEYRQLSAEEREKVHRAFQILYEEGTIAKYGRLYRKAWSIYRGGPAYLGFHRVFLAFFEEEIRRVDDSISLPYWDVTLDTQTDNPVNSLLWASPFFGNGNGEVVTGNFAGWKSPLGSIQRNYGGSIYGRLMNRETVRRILTKCRLQEVTYPTDNTDDEEFVIEFHNNGNLNWVGGTVSNHLVAPHDPLFYMLHAFIDYVWEMFRDRQQTQCNVNPARDYPTNPQLPGHAREDALIGFSKLTNQMALSTYWTSNWYSYEQTANCPDCGSTYLWCDTSKDECVAHSRRSDFNVGSYTDIPDIFEPDSGYIAKNKDYSMKPTPVNDGRSRATALRDAKKAVDDVRSRTLSNQAQRSRRSFPRPPSLRQFFHSFS